MEFPILSPDDIQEQITIITQELEESQAELNQAMDNGNQPLINLLVPEIIQLREILEQLGAKPIRRRRRPPKKRRKR